MILPTKYVIWLDFVSNYRIKGLSPSFRVERKITPRILKRPLVAHESFAARRAFEGPEGSC